MPDGTIAFAMEPEPCQEEDILTLLAFADRRVHTAREMILAGEACDQILKTLLQSQQSLRVARQLAIRRELKRSLWSIQNDACPDRRSSEMENLAEQMVKHVLK